ncbi:MAG: hypothetical protein K0U12_05035, partial [Gammaproteobacteria bacterium]|nr:hypothetical protein [Gammaproteobacteria bacterium]
MVAISFNLQQLQGWIGLSKTTHVGLDLDPGSVILVQFDGNPAAPQLSHFTMTTVSNDTLAENNLDETAALAKTIQQAKIIAGIGNASSVIAAPSKLVNTHELHIRKQKSTSQYENLVWNAARKVFPDIFNKLYMDYHLLPNETNKSCELSLVPVTMTTSILIIRNHDNT